MSYNFAPSTEARLMLLAADFHRRLIKRGRAMQPPVTFGGDFPCDQVWHDIVSEWVKLRLVALGSIGLNPLAADDRVEVFECFVRDLGIVLSNLRERREAESHPSVSKRRRESR